MKRPLFLTIWLGLVSLGVIYSIYTSNTYGLAFTDATIYTPPLARLSLTVMGLAELGAIVSLWRGRKLGFYLLIVSASVTALFNPMTTSIFFSIVEISILYIAMKPVWNHFK